MSYLKSAVVELLEKKIEHYANEAATAEQAYARSLAKTQEEALTRIDNLLVFRKKIADAHRRKDWKVAADLSYKAYSEYNKMGPAPKKSTHQVNLETLIAELKDVVALLNASSMDRITVSDAKALNIIKIVRFSRGF